MEVLDGVSLVASATSLTGFVPQIVKIYRTKSARDMSVLMFVNFMICSIAWIAYGLMTGARAVWVTNIFALILNMILVGQWLYYRAT